MSTSYFRSIVPQFTVPDVVRTAEYYRDVWGCRIAGYWQDPPVFAIVERDGVELFFNQARPGTTPRTGRVAGGYDVYLHCGRIAEGAGFWRLKTHKAGDPAASSSRARARERPWNNPEIEWPDDTKTLESAGGGPAAVPVRPLQRPGGDLRPV
jgi:hypothetical protein